MEGERLPRNVWISLCGNNWIYSTIKIILTCDRQTLYPDLIDRLQSLNLVSHLAIRITTKTLETVIDYSKAVYCLHQQQDFKKTCINIYKSKQYISYINNICLEK